MSSLVAVRRFVSRISVRMLAFNLLLVFLPAAGFLYLDVYEKQLLRAQERSMGQQGRILAAALSERGGFGAGDAEEILIEMGQRITARIRASSGLGASPAKRMTARCRAPVPTGSTGWVRGSSVSRACSFAGLLPQPSAPSPVRPTRASEASRSTPRWRDATAPPPGSVRDSAP